MFCSFVNIENARIPLFGYQEKINSVKLKCFVNWQTFDLNVKELQDRLNLIFIFQNKNLHWAMKIA